MARGKVCWQRLAQDDAWHSQVAGLAYQELWGQSEVNAPAEGLFLAFPPRFSASMSQFARPAHAATAGRPDRPQQQPVDGDEATQCWAASRLSGCPRGRQKCSVAPMLVLRNGNDQGRAGKWLDGEAARQTNGEGNSELRHFPQAAVYPSIGQAIALFTPAFRTLNVVSLLLSFSALVSCFSCFPILHHHLPVFPLPPSSYYSCSVSQAACSFAPELSRTKLPAVGPCR